MTKPTEKMIDDTIGDINYIGLSRCVGTWDMLKGTEMMNVIDELIVKAARVDELEKEQSNVDQYIQEVAYILFNHNIDTDMCDKYTSHFKELQRLAEVGEALELFETSELDYDGVVNNITGLLAWSRNEVKNG